MADVPSWYFKAERLAAEGVAPAQIAERLGVRRPAVTRAIKEVRRRCGIPRREADVRGPEFALEEPLRTEFAAAIRAALDRMQDAAANDVDLELGAGLVTGPLNQTLLSGTFDLGWLAVELAERLHADGDALLHRLSACPGHGANAVKVKYRASED
jgi:hypothetical protein